MGCRSWATSRPTGVCYYITHWFLENFDKNSDAKAALAHRMLTDDNLLGKPDPGESLFFDGGSTCNAVAHAIVDHRNTVAFNDVFTNNFVAAFYMASHGISCWLIGGRLDIGAVPEAYGALIGEFALHALESVSSVHYYVRDFNQCPSSPEKRPLCTRTLPGVQAERRSRTRSRIRCV